jgi:hypothetical protein
MLSNVMRHWAYLMMGLLVASCALANTAYGQETWYLGEGAQKGLLVKYRISTFDYLQSGGSPFEATIWFGSQDDKGNWVTDVIIEERGNVVTSKMTLSALNLAPIGLDITDEFRPYRNAIKDSIGWVGQYASKIEQEGLTGNKAWGVVAAIGGGSIIVAPVGAETIEAAGQKWDTAIVGFHYAQDSKVWIKDGFPLPIKALVYTIATVQPLPVQFQFDLLEMRISDTPPPVPEVKLVPPTPPLHQQTTSGGFSVDLYWKPETIEPGKPVMLGVVFFDRQQNIVQDARYNILVTDSTGKVVLDEKSILSDRGQGKHEVTFESGGRTHVTVTFLGGEAGLEHQITEKAEFDLVVIPEFPVVLAAMVAVIAVMVAVTRFGNINVTSTIS